MNPQIMVSKFGITELAIASILRCHVRFRGVQQEARLAHFRGPRSTPRAIRAIDTGLKV